MSWGSGGRGFNWLGHNKSDKLWIVFDCNTEYAGTSLNKEVLQGSDLTNRLLGVLIRFREDQVALMGDIEAMFHQVKVSPQDWEALRFLWWKSGDKQVHLRFWTTHLLILGQILWMAAQSATVLVLSVLWTHMYYSEPRNQTGGLLCPWCYQPFKSAQGLLKVLESTEEQRLLAEWYIVELQNDTHVHSPQLIFMLGAYLTSGVV